MERRAAGFALGLAALALTTPSLADEPSPGTSNGSNEENTISAESTSEPEEVNVTGTRLVETGGSTQVIKDAQLRRFSYDNPDQVVRMVPGVFVRTEDGMGLRPNIGIRGAASDRSKKITLMEDGVLVGPAPYSAPAAYYFPLIDRMQAMRVLKGPSAIVYGPQTVGGAIDLVTRSIPADRKLTYDLAYGQYGFNKQHVTFGASDENVGFLIEGMRLDTDGFKDRDDGGDTGFTRNEWMVKGAWVPDPRSSIQQDLLLKLGYSDERSNETYLGLSDADFAASPNRRYLASQGDLMKNHRTAVELTHRLRPWSHFEMLTTAYRHDFARIWRKVNGFRGADIFDVLTNDTPRNRVYTGVLKGDVDSTSDAETILIGPNDRTFVSQGLQTQVRIEGDTGPISHKVTYGARAHYDSIVRKHTQDGFRMISRELVPDGRVTQVTADNKAETYALALWATDAIGIGPVILTPGIRIEAIHAAYRDSLTRSTDGATYQVVLPGASAYWGILREQRTRRNTRPQDLGVFAGVHKGFSPVPPEQARSAKPEESVNYEGGVRWAMPGVRAEAIGFYNDYQNITDICTFSSGCTAANLDRQFSGGRARILGAELFAETELQLGNGFLLPTRAAYTYTYTEFLSTFTSEDPIFGEVHRGDEIPYVPPNQFSGAVGLEKNPWGINVAGTYVDSMREKAGQGTPPPSTLTDPYFLLDASAKYRIWKHLELYVNGRNLLDDRYIAARRPFGARPGAPLWIIVGIRGEI